MTQTKPTKITLQKKKILVSNPFKDKEKEVCYEDLKIYFPCLLFKNKYFEMKVKNKPNQSITHTLTQNHSVT